MNGQLQGKAHVPRVGLLSTGSQMNSGTGTRIRNKTGRPFLNKLRLCQQQQEGLAAATPLPFPPLGCEPASSDSNGSSNKDPVEPITLLPSGQQPPLRKVTAWDNAFKNIITPSPQSDVQGDSSDLSGQLMHDKMLNRFIHGPYQYNMMETGDASENANGVQQKLSNSANDSMPIDPDKAHPQLFRTWDLVSETDSGAEVDRSPRAAVPAPHPAKAPAGMEAQATLQEAAPATPPTTEEAARPNQTRGWRKPSRPTLTYDADPVQRLIGTWQGKQATCVFTSWSEGRSPY